MGAVPAGVSPPTSAVALLPPGPLTPGPASASARQSVVLGGGSVGPNHPVPAAARRAVVVLRDEVTADDADPVARADLVVLQPLSPDEADLVAPALGLAAGREWLSRIPAGMLGTVAHPGTARATLRWALLSRTDLETQLIGSTGRVAIY